ncbi:DNA-(apurinic or apyrimidinic site) endonuclease 2 isoform X2 [Nymphaea colorata]|uniref:DNA-(apurinic or apyrimidinic site) endonuclease 2 isoform X2 n=1 Tax=Nymphaea colorata TaxID=210225 RepID=UPI00129D8B85|nr:DNA-(apurinic or apyrimidinic site) endonuclease 2 isoform X2 [Nymphaea colorata]
MKLVTYNVNGLRPRISQHGSLRNLLSSLDADIICFQETKLTRQELSADLVMAEGYEAFISCTRTSSKGRPIGYSGVVTFCRVKSAFSSDEVALPISAEEGFTGLLDQSKTRDKKISTSILERLLCAEELEQITEKDLLRVDSEGRCVITDHGDFVLFNLYGPRADSGNPERVRFKMIFFTALQKRWEALLSEGKRVIVVGDFNIAPFAIDQCDAGPDFENDRFRRWLRSLLRKEGGPFVDVFHEIHPERKHAYTCWSQNTGAEEFNFGSRIDLIMIGGPCFHQDADLRGHELFNCHVRECDIMTQFKRCKSDNDARWKGGRSLKLDGSDHVPVFINICGMPPVPPHSTPPLAARYVPEIRGLQQTIVSLIQRRPVTAATNDEKIPHNRHGKEKIKHRGYSQLKLLSFFERKVTMPNVNACDDATDTSFRQEDLPVREPNSCLEENYMTDSSQISMSRFEDIECQPDSVDASLASMSGAVSGPGHSTEKDKNRTALVEWQKIQMLMQNSVPLCVGHGEPCVARCVKKPGPNIGRGFYVCARAKGPASNADARCDHFQWATSKSKRKQR